MNKELVYRTVKSTELSTYMTTFQCCTKTVTSCIGKNTHGVYKIVRGCIVLSTLVTAKRSHTMDISYKHS